MPCAATGYSDSLAANRYDSASFQHVSMTCDEFGNNRDSLLSRHIG